MTYPCRKIVQATVIATLVIAGCSPAGMYLVPESASLSPITQEIGAVFRLTEVDPPGGPAIVALTSRGIGRVMLQDGRPAALLHLRVAFRNRTGLDITFNAQSTTVSAPPLLIQAIPPTWVYPTEKRPIPELVSAGQEAVYDLYFVLGPPDVTARIRAVSVTWEYTLGDKPFGTTTVFYRAAALPARPYGYASRIYDPLDVLYVDSPIHVWWWWPIHVGGGSYSPAPTWRRK